MGLEARTCGVRAAVPAARGLPGLPTGQGCCGAPFQYPKPELARQHIETVSSHWRAEIEPRPRAAAQARRGQQHRSFHSGCRPWDLNSHLARSRHCTILLIPTSFESSRQQACTLRTEEDRNAREETLPYRLTRGTAARPLPGYFTLMRIRSRDWLLCAALCLLACAR